MNDSGEVGRKAILGKIPAGNILIDSRKEDAKGNRRREGGARKPMHPG